MGIQAIGTGGSLTQQTTQARTWYDPILLDRLTDILSIVPYGRPSSLPRNSGQTVDWRRLQSLAPVTTPLTEGVNPAGSDLSFQTVTAVPFLFGDFVEWSDYFEMTAPDANVAAIIALQGEQAAETFDFVTSTALVIGTGVTYASGVANRGLVNTPLTKADLDAAQLSLRSVNAPFLRSWIPRENTTAAVPGPPGYVAFLTPAQWDVMKDVTDGGVKIITRAENYGTEESRLPNELGRYEHIRFVEHSNGQIAAGAGASSKDVHLIPMIAQDAFGVVRIAGETIRALARPIDSPDSNDPLGRTGHVGWKGSFAATILDQARLVRMEMTLS